MDSWEAQTTLQAFTWLFTLPGSHQVTSPHLAPDCLVSKSIKWYYSASLGNEEELCDSGYLIKCCSLDAKSDYSTDFSQPLSSPVVWKLQVRYCSQLHPGNSNQFQSQAGKKSAYAGLILTSPQFVYVCTWRARGWHTAATLWQQYYLPSRVQEGEMKSHFPSGNYCENFKQGECNYLKWNRTLYPSHHST